MPKGFLKTLFTSSRRAKFRFNLSFAEKRVPYIPHDLVLYIAVLLWDDAAALHAFTLVCRSWREAAQPLLFRVIAITNQERLLLLDTYVQGSPTVSSWIRELDIDRSTQSGQALGLGPASSTEPTSWFFRIAPKLADKMVNLTTLNFSHITETGLLLTPTFFQQLSSFKQVRELSLTDHHLTDPVLFAFISAFPNVRDLKIRNHHRHIAPSLEMPCLHPPRLSSLQFDIAINPFDTVTPLLGWLRTTPSVGTLRSVSLRNVLGTLRMDGFVCVAEHVGAFLKECTSLEQLVLTFVDKNDVTRNDDDAVLVRHFDFSHNPSLREVEFQDPRDGGFLVPHLLSAVSPCAEIRKITIDLTYLIPPLLTAPTDTHFDRRHAEIAKTLCEPTFKALEEVCLVVSTPQAGLQHKGSKVHLTREQVLMPVYHPLFDKGIAKVVHVGGRGRHPW